MEKIIKHTSFFLLSMPLVLYAFALTRTYVDSEDSYELLQAKKRNVISCSPTRPMDSDIDNVRDVIIHIESIHPAINHERAHESMNHPILPGSGNQKSCPHMLGAPGSLCGLTEHKRRSLKMPGC